MQFSTFSIVLVLYYNNARFGFPVGAVGRTWLGVFWTFLFILGIGMVEGCRSGLTCWNWLMKEREIIGRRCEEVDIALVIVIGIVIIIVTIEKREIEYQ